MEEVDEAEAALDDVRAYVRRAVDIEAAARQWAEAEGWHVRCECSICEALRRVLDG